MPAGRGRGPVGLNHVGHRLLLEGRYADAETYLRRAVALRPGYAYAQYNLGWCLLAQGKAAAALGPLQESAARQPERAEPLEKLAEAYRLLNDAERAEQAARRARELRGHGGMGDATPAGPVRSAVDGGSWVGSTDQREQRFLSEWRALKLARVNTTGQ